MLSDGEATRVHLFSWSTAGRRHHGRPVAVPEAFISVRRVRRLCLQRPLLSIVQRGPVVRC